LSIQPSDCHLMAKLRIAVVTIDKWSILAHT
jgi:hypothetical protein